MGLSQRRRRPAEREEKDTQEQQDHRGENKRPVDAVVPYHSVSGSNKERANTERQIVQEGKPTASMRASHGQRGFFEDVAGEAPVLSDGVLASSRLRTAQASTSGVKGFCKKLLMPSSCPVMMPTSSIYPEMNRVRKSGLITERCCANSLPAMPGMTTSVKRS